MSAEGNDQRTAAARHPLEVESVPFTGGCACGAIRYECSTEPLLSFRCHSHECQRVGGSAFTSLMITPGADFELLQGEPKHYASPADCGSPVLAREDHRPLLVLIHAGSMDDPSRFEPAADIFSTRAQPLGPHEPGTPQDPRDAPATGHRAFQNPAGLGSPGRPGHEVRAVPAATSSRPCLSPRRGRRRSRRARPCAAAGPWRRSHHRPCRPPPRSRRPWPPQGR
jgi:hypothetical protein